MHGALPIDVGVWSGNVYGGFFFECYQDINLIRLLLCESTCVTPAESVCLLLNNRCYWCSINGSYIAKWVK